MKTVLHTLVMILVSVPALAQQCDSTVGFCEKLGELGRCNNFPGICQSATIGGCRDVTAGRSSLAGFCTIGNYAADQGMCQGLVDNLDGRIQHVCVWDLPSTRCLPR